MDIKDMALKKESLALRRITRNVMANGRMRDNVYLMDTEGGKGFCITIDVYSMVCDALRLPWHDLCGDSLRFSIQGAATPAAFRQAYRLMRIYLKGEPVFLPGGYRCLLDDLGLIKRNATLSV
ncbi:MULTISPECIES: hypothetical protein [Dickeya]|uniref:Uncharacterized protein n=1 Tax=Dickeya aquatica TaxID=1401087 RepID=A0A375AD88_9GAMM|nr:MULTISPECIES: hypothetical protein [Dickeya]SLM63985.1 hypothetical protein DAQ1742_03162 [Dickeya aquatica]SLM64517.1 hypothetical protein DAQ1742_03723 [Dickeya aquatica]